MRLILLLALATTGCQLTGRRQEAKVVKPILPTTISRHELVEFLNGKTDGLNSWRCVNTQVHVRSPDLPFPQKLKGTLACSAPGQFRLVCDNTMGHADLGANKDICWAYVKPGESTVLQWRHEDSALLQHLPGGFPRLEPDWLMTILGLQPLDPERYQLQKAPLGSREVWLVAVEDAPDGTSLRRVIMVDTVLGVARQHALYDHELNPLLKAHLSDYKSCGGHELPHTVRIEFPTTNTQLTLNFTGIETDCPIADSLWSPPTGRNIEVVDLGDLVRRRMAHDPEFAREQQRLQNSQQTLRGQTAFGPGAASIDDGVPVARSGQLIADRQTAVTPVGDQRFYGSESSSKTPDFDDAHETSLDEPSMDEEFTRILSDDSAAPEFDVVAPSQSGKKRRNWFLFRKPRND
jgi:hypothetical protein